MTSSPLHGTDAYGVVTGKLTHGLEPSAGSTNVSDNTDRPFMLSTARSSRSPGNGAGCSPTCTHTSYSAPGRNAPAMPSVAPGNATITVTARSSGTTGAGNAVKRTCRRRSSSRNCQRTSSTRPSPTPTGSASTTCGALHPINTASGSTPGTTVCTAVNSTTG